MTDSLSKNEVSHNTLTVSQDRWFEAQQWEFQGWQKADSPCTWRQRIRSIFYYLLEKVYDQTEPKHWTEDWNGWWAERFNHYSFLPLQMENSLELGSGPYTNTRLVLNKIQINHVYCSDPLAKGYIHFDRGWLAWAHRKGKIWVDDHPAEETPFASNYFDLVIMINVLDHVRDALACLREAIRVTRPDGYFLLGQDLTGVEDYQREIPLDDIGHPIRIDHFTLDELLLPQFEIVMHKVLPREQGRNPACHYGTYIFVGKRLT